MKHDGPWLIEICPYCGEQIENPPSRFFRGHVHHGEQEIHGHSEPVYVSPQIVEVVRRGRRDFSMLDMLDAATAAVIEQDIRLDPDGRGPDRRTPADITYCAVEAAYRVVAGTAKGDR